MMMMITFFSYVACGCSVIKLILKSFGPVIKTNVMSPPVAGGRDLQREERCRVHEKHTTHARAHTHTPHTPLAVDRVNVTALCAGMTSATSAMPTLHPCERKLGGSCERVRGAWLAS